MRKDLIGRNLPFHEQQALANENGVIIPDLLQRILFNFLEHIGTNIYPDGSDPWTYARTTTLIQDGHGNDWPSGCGAGGPSGLRVCGHFFDYDYVGVGVALAAEVPAIGP